MPHVLVAVPFALGLFATCLAAGAQEPPPELTWKQLVARPDLWPKKCKVTKDQQWNEGKITAGTECPVVELRNESAIVQLSPTSSGEVRPEVTDVLAVAKAAWRAMTPAQRELDLPALARRADLWPAKVTLQRGLDRLGFDGKGALPAGSQVDFGAWDGKWVRVRHPKIEGLGPLRLGDTDFVELARAAAAGPAGKGRRVLRDLDGKLVHASTGAKQKLSPDAAPEYLLLYFSAGWCGPCQKFSPQLVAFHQKHGKHVGKRFQTVWISRDKSEADMRRYGKQHDFPWLAVAWKDLDKVPVTQAYAYAGIPDLILLDANGAVLATSYEGADYPGPDPVLAALEERLAKAR